MIRAKIGSTWDGGLEILKGTALSASVALVTSSFLLLLVRHLLLLAWHLLLLASCYCTALSARILHLHFSPDREAGKQEVSRQLDLDRGNTK